MRKAAIDVGSNSVILVVAEQIAGRWQPVFEDTRVTGLGQGTKSSGVLRADRMDATLDWLKLCFAKAQELGAESILAGGTMALRIAENAPEFLDRAEAQGTPVHVISGEKEAELGFWSVAHDPLFANAAKLAIIDPGGHSTELLAAERDGGEWKISFRQSFPVGALGLRDGLLSAPSPGAAEQFRAACEVDALLTGAPTDLGQAIVLGATGTNLVSIREKYETWQPDRVHGSNLDFEEVGRATGWLCGMDDEERARLPGLESGREFTIHIGCLILERFMNAIRANDVTVSVRGWRHALIEQGLT